MNVRSIFTASFREDPVSSKVGVVPRAISACSAVAQAVLRTVRMIRTCTPARFADHFFAIRLDTWCEEVRGTAEHRNRLEAADKIKRCYFENSKHLNLSYLRLTSLPSLIEELTQLESLNLSNNQITDLAPLIHLPQLRLLRLWGNPLTDVAYLAHLPQLKLVWPSSIDDLDPLQVAKEYDRSRPS